MVRSDWGFPIGYSPDGLVGDDGLIEIKSRKQKIQLATILADEVPLENLAQIQCGLLVSGRKWLDYVSYCGGMPLYTKRVHPDARWREAIIEAVAAAEDEAATQIGAYLHAAVGLPPTERIDHYAEMSI
jgi:predicted phage-related endonuclease